jgi:hypothetical protein
MRTMDSDFSMNGLTHTLKMKKVCCMFVLLSVIFLFVASMANAGDCLSHTFTSKDQENHIDLLKQMSSSQIETLSKVYPDFRILKLCSGRFGGGDRDELVLGVWWKCEVHRVGLIWNQNRWEVHIIDDEIEKDKKASRSYPMNWQYTFDNKGFSGEMKCGIDSEFRDNSDLTYALGDKPFSDLKEKGFQNNKPVCFATSDVYNNWDCVVYSPEDKRFLLWFQQAYAD